MKRLLAVAVLFFSALVQAAELKTSAGTMEVGGTVSFTPSIMMPDQGDNQVSYILAIAPSAGYFLLDNLELTGGFSAIMFFGDNTDQAPKLVGFDLGARYYLKMGALSPFFGLSAGMNFTIPKQGDTEKSINIAAPIGVLYALNEHVGLLAGLNINFSLDLDDPKVNILTIPIGYFGLRAFF
jgi:hypothetical protein